MGGGPEVLGNYELLTEFDLDYAPVKVSKYRSKKTGFSVVVGNYKAPITNAYFAVATEIFDDTGRPHTLEHLIFLGSDRYPYKGILDTLANRAGGAGTNAWTGEDTTAYTISTAGSEGFLNMLTIYLDHILYPTITKAGFVTEVFHINGKAEEAGVVMSEMQAMEQNPASVIARKLQTTLYPKTSAYRSETGGMLSSLRKLTVEEIREYHARTYLPHNVCLHIDGSIPLDRLMHILNNEVDPLILSHSDGKPTTSPAGWKRPFLETSSAEGPVIMKSSKEVVEFMDKDESAGEIQIVWRGPKTGNGFEELALDVLTTYLTDSEVAPLNKHFIEIESPKCTSIGFYSEDRATASEFTCGINGVPYALLDTFDDELKAVLKDLAGVGGTGGIDIERMHTVIKRDRRKLLASAESGLTDLLSDVVIADFVYADPSGKDLAGAFDDLKWYDRMLSWGVTEWAALLKKYLVENPSITVVGKPSAALGDKLDAEEKARAEKRRSDLGEAGLKAKAKELEEAQKENDREIPAKIIEDFPISDASKIDWIPVESAINSPGSSRKKGFRVQDHIDSDGSPLPFYIHYAHVESAFITLRVVMDTTTLPADLRPYLTLYENSIFALPVMRSGALLSFEEVVSQLTSLTVSYDSGLSLRGDFPELFQLVIKVEKEEYANAISWLRDLIASSLFEMERIKVVASKLLQDLPRRKRNGSRVASATVTDLVTDSTKSSSVSTGLLRALDFLPEVVKEIEEAPEAVLMKLEAIRKHLLRPESMRVAVAGNVLSLQQPRSAWSQNFLKLRTSTLLPVLPARATLNAIGLAPARKAIVTSMSIDGSFASVYGKGPVGWAAEDLTACKIAAEVLNALESYFWKRIRGAGLAYGASVDVENEYGLLSFSIYRSPDAYKAFEAAGKVLDGLVDGSIELEQSIIDGAKSSMSYTYARQEGNVGAAASTVMMNEVFKGIPADAGAKLLASLKDVSTEDVRRVLKQYWQPLFSAKSCVIAVACAESLSDKIADQLTAAGFEVERRQLQSSGDDDDVSMSGTESDDDADPVPVNDDSDSGPGSDGTSSDDGQDSDDPAGNGSDDDGRSAMLAALQAHGRAFMGNAVAGPSRQEARAAATDRQPTERKALSTSQTAETRSTRSQFGQKQDGKQGLSARLGGSSSSEEDAEAEEWNGFEQDVTLESSPPAEVVPTIVFGGGNGSGKTEMSKADRKKFMSAKSSKMLQDEDFTAAATGRKRKAAPDDADDEDRSNAALDKTLQNMLMTNLLASAANPSRPVEKRNAMKGRLMELANISSLGRGSTEVHEKSYDAQPLRIRSGIRRAQGERDAKEIVEARAAGSYSNKIGGLADGAGAGRAKVLANKHLQGKKEDKRERDRGFGMGIGKFKGGMLTLSKKEVQLGAGERGGGDKKPARKAKKVRR